ncbi:uncharacterized protein LOC133290031 [Gastrolobium bilobum]|uniref:uncharacterized protein LOC133290031 n=1 Tax=Gastrolobium bilobum TaxID=150636 RepID=UPI002AB2892A|nr:uncharacterized protein LOC133290031 [Gastrolobium bilobum]
MGKFKAPGPDGLQAVFFQSHWKLVGDSVCRLIVVIFLDPGKVKEINKSLICLIPKKDCPECMKDFRPISLCNVVYKAVTKIITDRLRDFMPRLVAPNQCSFIKGRQSADNNIVAQEVVHSMKGKKGNGGLTKEFKPKRGIRQGDPISPYLFVLCVERLAHLIQLVVDTKAWKPVLKISVEKSRVCFSSNVGFNRAKEISECLGVGVTSDLGKYLRVNLNHKRVSRKSLNYVVERVQCRMSSWSQNVLSLAGRVTLAKSVLETLPAYAMQTIDVPSGTCKEVEKLTRRFIWGSSSTKRKVHLVSWNNICRRKTEGGLGLRDQSLVNKAYAMKIGFGVMTNSGSLWARILRSKYKVDSGLVPMLKEARSNSNTWRSVCKSWSHVQEGVKILIGNGTQTMFWVG